MEPPALYLPMMIKILTLHIVLPNEIVPADAFDMNEESTSCVMLIKDLYLELYIKLVRIILITW